MSSKKLLTIFLTMTLLGSIIMPINANAQQTASISGFKWDDQNANGIWDAGEPGIPNVEICAYVYGVFQTVCTTTNGTGMYWLDVPVLGNTTDVYVYEILPNGTIQTYPEFGGGHWIEDVEPGEVIDGINFGNTAISNLPTASIHGFKWDDIINNGQWDAGEPGIPNVEICAGVFVFGEIPFTTVCTTTNGTGMYWLEVPTIGNFTGVYVYEILPNGTIQTYPEFGGGHWIEDVEPNEVIDDVNFGNRALTQLPDDIVIPSEVGEDDGIPLHGRSTPLEIIKTIDFCNPVEVLAVIEWSDGTKVEKLMTSIGDNQWQVIIYPSETGGIFFPSGTATLTIYVDCDPDTPNFPPDEPGLEDAIEIGDVIFIDPSGTITESCTNGPLEGATVTLYVYDPNTNNFVPATSGIMPPTNPQVTGSDGRYGWLTVAGTYKVLVEKDGYNSEWSSEVTVPPPVNDLNVELDRTDGCDFGILEANPDPIPTPGSSTDLTLTMESSGLGDTVVTAWIVNEPDGDVCQVAVLPSPIPPGGSATKKYPDDFIISGTLDDSNTGNNTCDTNTIGAYTTEVQTEIGDPIIKTFYIAFNVLNEATIGSIALVGAGIAAFMMYSYRKRIN